MTPAAPQHATPDGHDWHELEVANPSFFVEKLGAECSDLQGLRELTVPMSYVEERSGLLAVAAMDRRAWRQRVGRRDRTYRRRLPVGR